MNASTSPSTLIGCPSRGDGLGTSPTSMPSYLRRLEWPVTQSRIGITYIELALNFEVTSGLDLPISHKKAQQAKQATDSSTSTGISLAVRALCPRWMLHLSNVCLPCLLSTWVNHSPSSTVLVSSGSHAPVASPNVRSSWARPRPNGNCMRPTSHPPHPASKARPESWPFGFRGLAAKVYPSAFTRARLGRRPQACLGQRTPSSRQSLRHRKEMGSRGGGHPPANDPARLLPLSQRLLHPHDPPRQG